MLLQELRAQVDTEAANGLSKVLLSAGIGPRAHHLNNSYDVDQVAGYNVFMASCFPHFIFHMHVVYHLNLSKQYLAVC